MKSLKFQKALGLFFALAMTSGIAFAHQPGNKAIEKARIAVENAGPDDWHTLAASAEKCLNRKTNLKEANEWIDRSIEIKPTAYNLSLKGDYYYINKLPEKAMEYYVKAVTTAKSEDLNADVSDIQQKIARIAEVGE